MTDADARPEADELAHLIGDEPMRVVVIGGGVGGLVAARELARPGFEVTVLEAAERVGGSVAPLMLPGVRADGGELTVDAGAESFATRGGAAAELLEELGLTGEVVQPNPAGAWLQLPGRAVPMPKGGMLGIPAVPLARDVIEAIGWRGALRAYLDRVMPVLKIGQERNLERLVLRRMGRAVLDDLVAPVTTGVYSADPSQLDVAIAAPGLNPALTRAGSLSGAVAELRAGGPSKAGSAVGGLRGGIRRLVEVLAVDAAHRGAEIRTGSRVVAVELVEQTAALAEAAAEAGAEPVRPPRYLVHVDGAAEPLPADALLVDVPSAVALPLLAPLSPELAAAAAQPWPEATSVELVTLVLDAPALDAAPRGTGLLVSDRVDPSRISAKAMTHVTAKWAWVAEQLPAGRHVVRLSYGRAGRPDETAALSDASLRARAVADAAALLDIPLSESMVVGFARVRWQNAQPLAGAGQLDRLAVLRAAVEGTEAVEVTGAWIAGTGLASVIPHARGAAARLRALRWRALTESD